MRTTLHIDDDLLAAVKSLARHEGCTAGDVVSRLLRQTLSSREQGSAHEVHRTARARVAGFEPFAARPGVVTTNDQVDALREAESP